MKHITDFFRRPEFSRVNHHLIPENKRAQEVRNDPDPSAPSSSPLTEPPPSSFFIDLTSDYRNDSADDSSPQLSAIPSQIGERCASTLSVQEQSSQSVGSVPPPSSLNESFPVPQRILKGGKEVVISSDGEDTESISSLEDPDTLFAPKPKQEQDMARTTKDMVQPNRALLARLSAPKEYKNTIDSLVVAAVDDNEIEANVAKARATLTTPVSQESTPGEGEVRTRKSLHEGMLTSALVDGEEQDESGLRRLLDAVRRTEALDHDRAWRFFDQTPTRPAVLEFPTHLFPPRSHLAALREPESRIRVFQSGILEFAASLQRLPDEFILWLFRSVPLEPLEELRQAYRRVFMIQHTSAQRVESLVCPSDVDNLFRSLGAKSQALDLSEAIVEDTSEKLTQGPRLKDRAALLSVFDLLHGAAELFSNDTREHAVHILLRTTLDTSLTADSTICAELQGALSALLESVPYKNVQHMERRICRTLYGTVKHAQFQSRILQHILPTSTWISLLRYRLATAFLLQTSSPLTEPPEVVLDLKRFTVFLMRDERFHLKSYKGKSDYDYGELTALAMLLDIVINSSLCDLNLIQGSNENKFDAAIDKLATQIKKIFSSIEDTGASHLKRMLAKEALEALYYRVVYSVRSKPPPKKSLFKTFAREDGNIRSIFNSKIAINSTDDGEIDSDDGTDAIAMPIRESSHPS
ncbi:uncharacterized protein N7459_001782 [Penicillium hispanicum]|uniref:uncharacterized protein n=1 Tax=Penicillium hispanicum TaxID=1080232 RepID=UPI0025408531|nr:uncharacterized protein N7459_001782 [Penicillium hispanicum]KAJ5595574.1 hypothetical protein N7459_001782 [Penicillium hispanicum]